MAQNLKEYKVSVFVGVSLLVEAIYKNVEKEIEKKGKTKLINTATCKSPNVMLGYYENEEATKAVLKDGKKVFPEELEVFAKKRIVPIF